MRTKIEPNKIENFICYIVFLFPIFFIDYVNSYIGIVAFGCMYLLFLAIKQKRMVFRISFLNLCFGILGSWILLSAFIFNTSSSLGVLYLLLLIEWIIFSNTKNDMNIPIRIIEMFGAFHTVCTLLIQIIPEEVSNAILRILLRNSFNINFNWRVIQGYNCGITLQPGENAMYVFLFYSVMFSKWLITSKKKYLYLVFISYVALLTTGKRATLILAIIISLVVYVLVRGIKITKKRLIVLGSSLLVGVFSFVIAIKKTNVLNALHNKLILGEELNDISGGRFVIWEMAWKIFCENFIIGNGIKSIYSAIGLDVHNNYIQFLAELGIIGFLIFLIFILQIVKISIKKLKGVNIVFLDNIEKRNIYIQHVFSAFIILFLVAYAFLGNPFVDYIPLGIFIIACIILVKE